VLAGRPAGQALSALWYLGRHQALREAKPVMPSWMAEALNRYERNEPAHA